MHHLAYSIHIIYIYIFMYHIYICTYIEAFKDFKKTRLKLKIEHACASKSIIPIMIQISHEENKNFWQYAVSR